MKKIAKIVRKTITNHLKRLPPKYFILYARFIYPLISLRIPCFEHEIKVVSDGCVNIKDLKTESENWFFSPYRSTRYVLSGGFLGSGRVLARTYLIKDIEFKFDDVVIEVGSSIGELSNWLVREKNISRLFCFEVDPKAIKCLKKNCPGAEVVEKAASDENGESLFFLKSDEASSSLLQDDETSSSIRVPTIRLDSFLLSKGISEVKLLKVEAEGAEPEVLSGLGKRIKDIKYIAVDVGPERGGEPTIKEVTELLENNNFEVELYRYHLLGRNRSISDVDVRS